MATNPEVQQRSDGHVYYVIGGTGGTSAGASWCYKSNGQCFVDASSATLNLIGGHVLINGVDFSTVAIGNLAEYAKMTDVNTAINAKFTAMNQNFSVGTNGSVWIRRVEESINKLPANYTTIKSIVGKVNAVLEALGSKVGVVDPTAVALNGEKIEPMKKMFFIKVNKMITTVPASNVKYYVRSGDSYVEGGVVVDEGVRSWASGDVYTNENPTARADMEELDWNEIDIIAHLCEIDDKLNKIIEVVNAYIG